MSGLTFAVEQKYGSNFLCVVDCHGVSKQIAEFYNRESIADFKSALNLAKLSAHAAGQSGI